MPQQYGDLVRFSVPRQEAFLVNRPEYIKNILQDNHRNYTKRTIQYDALAQITGRALMPQTQIRTAGLCPFSFG